MPQEILVTVRAGGLQAAGSRVTAFPGPFHASRLSLLTAAPEAAGQAAASPLHRREKQRLGKAHAFLEGR